MLRFTRNARSRLVLTTLRMWGGLGGERGQTSAEYALVLFGAASVAMLVALWARNTDQVGKLLDAVFGNLVKMVR
jgi:Flp pilus assembly pilin Flp